MRKILRTFFGKKWVWISLIAVLGSMGYFYFGWGDPKKEEVRYITASLEKGNLIESLSGTGQVSQTNSLEIKPKVSGDVVSVKVSLGQVVKEGDLILTIDSQEAQKAARDAYTALETSNLELKKLIEPSGDLDILRAENALTLAKRNLENLVNPEDSVISQVEYSLTSARDSLTKLKFSQEMAYENAVKADLKAREDLETKYEETFNSIANTYLELPTLISVVNDILYSSEISESEWLLSPTWNIAAIRDSVNYNDKERVFIDKYIGIAETDYQNAREKYDISFEKYKNINRNSQNEVIEVLLEETLDAIRAISTIIKSEINLLDYWVDYSLQKRARVFNKVTQYQTDLKGTTSKANSLLSGLLSAQRSLEDAKESILNAEQDLEEIQRNHPIDLVASERNVEEKEEALDKLLNPDSYEVEVAEIAVKEKELSLADLKAGADELDIRSKKISIQQKEESLLSARQNLKDYSVSAPFDGIIAQMNVKKGDPVSSGTVLVSLITEQEIAKITLNEIDVARVKVGQKASLEFDAVQGLSITGDVVEVDTLGTVNQGVVSYGVKIAFDVDDERIKSGMTISATLILDFKQDVLLAPLTSVKSIGDSIYVEVLVDGNPQRKNVEIGSSNDSYIEILSGISEGESIITQTLTGQVSVSGSQTPNVNASRNSGGSVQGMMRMMR